MNRQEMGKTGLWQLSGRHGERTLVLSEQDWAQAFETWLDSKASPSTRRIYCRAWQQLVLQTGKMPWELDRVMLQNWVEALQDQGYAMNSIRLWLGAISSFFSQLRSLGVENPTTGLRLRAGERLAGLPQEVVDSFLQAIPTNTLNGKRDYAMFLCYLTSGRGNNQVRSLQYKQIIRQAGRTWLVWLDGDRSRREACSPQLQQALERYLAEWHAADRTAQAYVFTAWTGGRSNGRPLSDSMVCRLAKKYSRQAGLEEDVNTKLLQITAREEKRTHAYRR
jgi:site-specific recombinase XerC